MDASPFSSVHCSPECVSHRCVRFSDGNADPDSYSAVQRVRQRHRSVGQGESDVRRIPLSDSHFNANAHAHTHANADANANLHSHANTDANANFHSYTDAYAHPNASALSGTRPRSAAVDTGSAKHDV